MKFENSHKMWEEYGKPYHYDPQLGLHFMSNERAAEKIKNQTIDDDLCTRLRQYCIAIRVHDPFVHNMIDCGMYNYLSHQAKEAGKPELFDEWDGFNQEQILSVINRYVGLINPLTMRYVNPNDEGIPVKNNNDIYIYTPETPVPETDRTFLYQTDRENKGLAYLALAAGHIYTQAEEYYIDMLPEELYKLYHEIE